MQNKTLVISLGGSLIVPDKINIDFLIRFKMVMADFVRRRNRAIIICGGGSIARLYNSAARKMNPHIQAKDLDSMGIEVTHVNAILVGNVFGGLAEIKILHNPTKKIETKKKIIIGCGWKPGCSTDKDAVIAAKTYGVNTVVNLSNITHIFDKNPKEFQDARPYKNMTWKELRQIVGNVWRPGAHVPFDPEAAKLGQKLKLKLIVMNGKNLKNFYHFLHHEKFVGTKVSDDAS